MARLTDKEVITRSLQTSNTPNASFRRELFTDAVIKHGYDVIFEKSLKCPCKSRNSESLSTCKNCGGSGWIFINPTKTKMVVQSMSLNPKFESWGMYSAEISSITALPEDKLSYMDRITVLGAITEFSEVLFPEIEQGSNFYAYTVYPIKEIFYLGFFVSDNQKLFRVNPQYISVLENRIIIDTDAFDELGSFDTENSSFVVRYKHNPRYHIIETVRDTMEARTFQGKKEIAFTMPINARAKRTDLIKDFENFNGDRLLDNSFDVCVNEENKFNKCL